MNSAKQNSSSTPVFHPPQKATFNHAAERAVIAALIRKPDGRGILQLGISTDLFTQPVTQEAMTAILAFITDGVNPDAATLENALSQRALIEVETSLLEHVSAANLPGYVQLLKNCRTERRIQEHRQWLIKAIAAGRPAAEIRALTDEIEALERPEKRRRTFQNLSALLDTPPSENWLVKGFIAADSTNVIFGDSGSGKSFIVIDLFCHIAAGIPWLFNTVKPGKVLYIAGEGQNGIIRRFKAWFEANGHYEARNNIEVRTMPAALCDAESTAILVDEIADMPEKPRAIAIDTLARNFGPGDENATRDMNQFVAGLDALRAVTQAAIIVPHHSGHGDKNRGRGSSVLKAAIDTEFQVERDEVDGQKSEIIRLRCSKMKDSEPPGGRAWKLTQQPLPWCDEEGMPMNSAILVPLLDYEVGEQSGTFSQKQRLTPSQRIAVDALRTALMQHGVEADGVVTVAEDQWRDAVRSSGISDSDNAESAKRAFRRARQDLIADKQVCTHDGRYWLPATKRTNPDKPGQCPDMSGGIADADPGRTRTHTYIGVSGVRVSADTQPSPEPIAADLMKSPTATRILDCLFGDLAGMADEVLIKTTSGKAGDALTRQTINALLLAGKISRVNGRLVATTQAVQP